MPISYVLQAAAIGHRLTAPIYVSGTRMDGPIVDIGNEHEIYHPGLTHHPPGQGAAGTVE